MRTGGLVAAVVVLLIACKDEKKGDPAPKPGPVSADAGAAAPKADPTLAKALAARTEPVLEMPPLATTKVGRCGVKIAPRNPADSEPLLAAFRARNGAEWKTMDPISPVDERTGYITFQLRDAAPDAPAVTLTAEQATALGAEFLATNHDLLGLDAGDVTASTVETVAGPANSKVTWDVRVKGERPRPGYERFPTVNRSWQVFINLGHDGKVRGFKAQSMSLAPFEMCTDVTLSTEDAKKAVVGHELRFSDISGESQSGGKVSAGDIKSAEPTIHVELGNDGYWTLSPAYRVELDDGMWSFVVHGETGKVIEVLQNFET